jgi:hypothetical protein
MRTDEVNLSYVNLSKRRPGNICKMGSPQEFVKAFKYRGFSDTAFLGTLGS